MDPDRFARDLPRLFADYPRSRHPLDRALLEANVRRHGLGGHTILEGDAFRLLREGALGGRRVGVYYYDYDAAHDYRSQLDALRLVEPHLVDGALLIVDDTDWTQVARALRDYRRSQPRARLMVELPGKDRGQPWWWEGVQVLAWGEPAAGARYRRTARSSRSSVRTSARRSRGSRKSSP